ncbi:sensor histidine kinase [Oxalicibacterium solurbis]|uniref:histidine kinase n=1 Tax=Oxalicibacterium solurbis TaxID=69280 RepID=A0A8J3F5M1_9BURK|nr:HAMP domain-containing sensor histidine kinase [Oxalicibacterium solurbis]GGI53743.1 two-component sensor histidine kinase [Oxalicibacterium solurbis]
MKLTLTQRLSIVFALLLLICSGTSAWLQLRSNDMHEQEVVQGVSRGLAEHIASRTQLMDEQGPMPGAVQRLFGQLMMVNPSVEVYLLDTEGRILEHALGPELLKRDSVDLAPIHRLLRGDMLPILGDDPRSADGRKVFSVAPLIVNGHDKGYIYVVLLSEAHDRFAARGITDAALMTTLWSIALVALLCLIAGLIAFTWITRPLRTLTEEVRRFDIDAEPVAPVAKEKKTSRNDNDEIAVLDSAFTQMMARLSEQWRRLRRQDQERREMIANVSHDLRTPLASIHGYLETLLLKDVSLTQEERRRYLGIALDQSSKVGALARSLFELVRLEQGFIRLEPETFSLTDLVQDVFQKFELTAETKHIALNAAFSPNVPPVHADLALIERALTNLIDNAIRHTPEGGEVEVAIVPDGDDAVHVTVRDTGSGIPAELRDGLFERPFNISGARREGGLGLRIVYRILQLHGSVLRLLDSEQGAMFEFQLPTRKDRDAS